MPALAPSALIARHVEKLRSQSGAEKVEQLLHGHGFRIDGVSVTHYGRPVTEQDCFEYKQAVREVYGDAAYSFARVNFVLGGCRCRACAA
jgi:hypothetical protein